MPLAREPTPPPAPPPAPAPPPVVKLGFKEWQARRKLEKAKEVEEAQERERDKLQQLELERERERERERGREKEKDDAQGEDKENKVVPKPEDGLARILDGIRRSAVGDKPPPDAPVRDDVEMADAPPVPRAPSPPPSTVVSVEAPKAKGTPLTFPAFAATGPEHLSPLSVSSSLHSRTPSPRLVNGLTREPSPLVVDGQGSPAMPNGIFKFTGSPFLNSSASSEPRRALPSLLRDPPPPFPDVDRRLSKPFTTAATASPPPLASNGAVKRFPNIPSLLHRSLPPESSPLSFSSHARVPSQEEGEILSPTLTAPLPLASRFTAGPQSTPRTSFASSSGPRRPSPFGSSFGPSRTSSFASGSGFSSSSGPPRAAPFTPSPVPPHASPFASSSVPPTQPRSHQANLMQRLPPSAPKALREAQASTAATAGPSGGAGRGGRFNGLVPQTMPANLLEPLPRTNRRGGNGRKRR
ncbi:hypothetical protein B0H16DRAFT_1617207 [Mycena metata]|uniref:Uncharacterized protein n=1 Tax=Mycena metata TaxID=1033252 RepID=A0AAD7H8D2_9AGAR|nr:hypothetical protein B0H16DRAFT_1617207 [Mycena metata]